MSQNGAVYQPTTVTYEANSPQQERWQDRISYLTSGLGRVERSPVPCLRDMSCTPLLLLINFIVVFTLGLITLINGVIGLSNNQPGDENFYVVIITIGAVLLCLSILFFVFFLRLSRKLCWRNAKDHLDTAGGQALTVNPSTDLLVAAQYAPVAEVAYQPPQEDTEQSKLMPQENKDLSNEDTDRMVESDPRIVLRPLNPPAHEET